MSRWKATHQKGCLDAITTGPTSSGHCYRQFGGIQALVGRRVAVSAKIAATSADRGGDAQFGRAGWGSSRRYSDVKDEDLWRDRHSWKRRFELSRSAYQRRAAEQERRHFITDASGTAWTRRGKRLAVGCVIIVWFVGSISLAYWMGAPYLQGADVGLNPVDSRLLAEALSRLDQVDASSTRDEDSNSDADADQARVDALERQISDAVVQIDAIRSDAVAAAFDRQARDEISRMRESISAAHRELEALRTDIDGMQGVAVVRGAVAFEDSPSEVGAAAEYPDVPTALASLSSESRTTRQWAIGAIGLSLVGNLLTLGLFLRRGRRQSSIPLADASAMSGDAMERDAGRQQDSTRLDEGAAGLTSDVEALKVGARQAAMGDMHSRDSSESEIARQMIEEMRRASVAGADAPSNAEAFDLPPLILVHDDEKTCRDVVPDVDVVAENRLGVDFAVRISDSERADLAGGGRGNSGSRIVA